MPAAVAAGQRWNAPGYRPGSDGELRRSQEEVLRRQSQEEKAPRHNVKHGKRVFVGWGFNAYFFFCSIVLWVPLLAVLALMSSMGAGLEFNRQLQEYQEVSLACGGLLTAMFLALYLADFFWPPHLPGCYCTFSPQDRALSNAVVALMALLLFGAGFFSAKDYPHMPILVTVVSAPALVAGVRAAHQPPQGRRPSLRRGSAVDDSERQQMLDAMAAYSRDWRNFYAGAMTAFFLNGGLAILVWICWVLGSEKDLAKGMNADHDEESGRVFLAESAPFCAGFGYMMFGVVAMLRVMFEDIMVDRRHAEVSSVFSATGKQPQRGSVADKSVMEALVERHLKSEPGFGDFLRKPQEERDKIIRHHVDHLKRVSHLIKYIGCGFFATVGLFYASFQLVAADSPAAQLFLGVLGAFGFFLAAFLVVCFSRFVAVMRDWCQELPLFRMAESVARNDWAKASFLCATVLVAPWFLLLSTVNQCVRRRRRLCEQIQTRAAHQKLGQASQQQRRDGRESGAAVPPHGPSLFDLAARNSTASDAHRGIIVRVAPTEDSWLTERVMITMEAIDGWDKISLMRKMHILCQAFVMFTLSPRLINILLSWLSSMFSGLPFWTVLAMVIVSGILCFLLPPVPGIPVYLFTGVLVVQECPLDFWPSCAIAVATGFVLKLCACAMQQKLIGELLGASMTVRSNVGVNKPLIRAIELVLREPSSIWTIGKVAILCGGPDWPTSVLAGLLRLPLTRTEAGTLPVVLFIAPCTLSGAFYLKRQESEFWSRAASLMIASTGLMGLGMWVAAAWAIQDKLDQEDWEVTRPLVKNIDLDWLDHRADEIAKSRPVSWTELPCIVKLIATAGLLASLSVCYIFYWKPDQCFGEFAVTDDIKTLEIWKGEDGLLKPMGALGLLVAVAGFLGYATLSCYIHSTQRDTFAKKASELNATEQQWKERRRLVAEDVEQKGKPLKLGGFHVDEEIGSEAMIRMSRAPKAACVDTE